MSRLGALGFGLSVCLLYVVIAGCSDSSSSSGFTVSGTLASTAVNASLEAGRAFPATNSGTVTDVMAVTPVASDAERVIAQLDSNGSFSLSLTAGKPWIVAFLDRSQTGAEMVLGLFQATELDTLPAAVGAAAADLATVTLNGSTGKAESSTSFGALVSALGIDATLADAIGSIDDIGLRYANPDIDGDGIFDRDQENRNFLLDFHIRFDMRQGGEDATFADITGAFLDPDSTVAAYSLTGVYVAYPSGYSRVETGSFTFVDSAVSTNEGGTIPANTPSSDVTTNSFGDYKGFGPNILPTSELPSGELRFEFDSKTLTFANVLSPSLSELTSFSGRIMPFIRFDRNDSSCTSNCTLSGISYKWMKKSESGWALASLAEVALLVAGDGGMISLRYEGDSEKTIGMTVPKTALEGTLAWNAGSVTLQGLTESEFLAATVEQLCHLGLSYDDQLGMRYFSSIQDAPGTCGQ